jgi:Rieske Fe-S protein
MDRRNFIRNSCTVCIGAATVGEIFSSCMATQFAAGRITKDGIIIDVKEFALKDKASYRSYIVVRNDALLFPICLYRFSEKEYTALWMQCAHQGAEVNVVGEYLQCPAHGSEYNNRGQVTHGPAERNLRTFPVIVENNELFIDLRKA